MHASVVRHYFNGGAYPIGGSARMFESIQPIIAAAGGLVVTNAEVKQVQTSGGKAVGVEMADGQVFTAPIIVSGAGVATTAYKLMNESDAQHAGLMKSLGKVDSSAAHLCLYLGFKGDAQTLNLPKANWVLSSRVCP